MNWYTGLKIKVREDSALARMTTFKIGGSARFFVEPQDISELRCLLGACKKNGLAVFVLGAGSNVLVSDRGVDGVVIRLKAPSFTRITAHQNAIEAGSGARLAKLLGLCADKGLSGVEFLTGIPGTVGGAVAMNAGISVDGKNLWIGDFVESVTVMDYNSRVSVLKKPAVRFGYRRSNLAPYIILSARIRVKAKDKKAVTQAIAEYRTRRRSTQQQEYANAGCIFKNPAGGSAGRLIDRAGLKGRRQGGAQVSETHANFIVNTGKASASDVLKLMQCVRQTVEKKYSVRLQPEIKIWR